MKHKKQRISKITDEVITYLFSLGASNININIEETHECFKILFKCNYSKGQPERIEKLSKALKSGKQEEIEEYYWGLAGDSDVDDELYLVGMMIDKARVEILEDSLEIELYRYKS